MVNEERLAQLKERVEAWNPWWKECCSVLHQRCALAFQRAWRTAAPAGRQGLQTIKDTGRKTFAHLRATSWQTIVSQHWKLFLVIGAVLVLSIIWKVPQWQAAGWRGQMEPKDLAKLQNDARTTLVQSLGGAALLIGLYLTLRNLQLTQDKQITEHYTRAVEQLGSDRLAVRLGAIYALERIARDSERDHWPIMEILTAYVRENAPWKAEEEHSHEELSPSEPQLTPNHQPPPKLASDIQAILKVLGRRTRTYEKSEDQRLDLKATDLRGANLMHAHLERAILADAHLERANLMHAHLEQAYLRHAHLEGALLTGAALQDAGLEGALLVNADLWYAHLEDAYLNDAHLEQAHFWYARLDRAHLWHTHLEGAHLWDTHLEQANFPGTYLEGADLRGAHLEGATNLTVKQLATVKTLYPGYLDPPLRARIQRQYPHLLEKPQDWPEWTPSGAR
jgi:uncharacterized protein YjbI with pentapeptide repeats